MPPPPPQKKKPKCPSENCWLGHIVPLAGNPRSNTVSEPSRLTSPHAMCGSILLSDTDTMPLLFPFFDLQRTSKSECVCMSQRDLEKETASNISKKMKHIIISYAQGCKAVGLKGKTEQTFPIFKPAFQSTALSKITIWASEISWQPALRNTSVCVVD